MRAAKCSRDIPRIVADNSLLNNVQFGLKFRICGLPMPTNYDLLFEQYLRPLGLIQAGFFYKDISDPIYTVRTPITSGFLPPPVISGAKLRACYGSAACWLDSGLLDGSLQHKLSPAFGLTVRSLTGTLVAGSRKPSIPSISRRGAKPSVEPL